LTGDDLVLYRDFDHPCMDFVDQFRSQQPRQIAHGLIVGNLGRADASKISINRL